MADLKKPLDQDALDALTLSSEEARAAYRKQRLTLEAARAIRHDRTQTDLTQTESAAKSGIDQDDLKQIEKGQRAKALREPLWSRTDHWVTLIAFGLVLLATVLKVISRFPG